MALAIGMWYAVSTPDQPLLPLPGRVLAELWNLTTTGVLIRDASVSLLRVLCGVGIATAAALMLGVLAAAWHGFAEIVSGPVELLRPIPPIAWTPLAIMVLGVGNASAIAIVAAGAFFPVWLGIMQGQSEVRTQHLMAARSLGANWRTLAVAIVWPSMAPYVLHGLRLGIGLGWFCLVAAEMMGASSGLGFRLQVFGLNLQISRFYAYLIVIGALGFALSALLGVMTRRIVRWRGDHVDNR